MGSLLPDVDEWELRTGGDDFGALEGLSLDDGFLFDMMDDTGTSFNNKTPPTGISDGSGGVGGGGGTLVASYSLRCIDESHPVDCSRCTPAPEDPDQVELLGDRGRKNGEKRLRALMTRVPEWNLASERAKLIPVAHAAGMPALASALQTKKTSALRKAHLLLMARHWHYRSDIWSVRHDRAAKKALEDMKRRAVQQQPVLCRFGEAAAAAAAGQWDESILVPEAVWLFTRKELRPLSMRVAAAFAGDEARAAALEHGDAHITTSACLEVRKVADLAAPMLGQLGFVHTALLSAQRALPAHMATMPAWQALSVAPFSAAEALLNGVLQSGLSHLSVVRKSSARRLRKGGLSAGEAAWLAEMEQSHATSLVLLNKVARVLNAFRAAALEDFLEVAGHMLELLIVLVNSLGSAATSRERWMRDLMAARSSREADPERSAVLVCWPPRPEELMEAEMDGGTDAFAMH